MDCTGILTLELSGTTAPGATPSLALMKDLFCRVWAEGTSRVSFRSDSASWHDASEGGECSLNTVIRWIYGCVRFNPGTLVCLGLWEVPTRPNKPEKL